MSWDIMGIVKSIWAIIVNIVIETIKIPLQIWFIWIPKQVRYSIIGVMVLVSLFFIWWAYKNRDEWLILAAKKKDLYNLEINGIEILMYNDNMAVITGKMTYLFGTEKIKQDLRFTQIFGNYNGQ